MSGQLRSASMVISTGKTSRATTAMQLKQVRSFGSQDQRASSDIVGLVRTADRIMSYLLFCYTYPTDPYSMRRILFVRAASGVRDALVQRACALDKLTSGSHESKKFLSDGPCSRLRPLVVQILNSKWSRSVRKCGVRYLSLTSLRRSA
jgi:hypothetical protein